MIKCRAPERGFTLIELMVTMALVAALMAVAIPSFKAFQRNSELSSFTNTLLAGINAARSEAMKRGMYAMVVPNDGVNWNSGWQVFVDKDRSQNYLAANDISVLKTDTPPSYLTISGNGTATGATPYIMFDASGYSKTKTGGFGALTFTIARNDVTANEQNEQTRRAVISSTGRVRICKPSTDSTCTTSATQ
ncbi:GspH/FimT family pseudopilin [Rhodoferax sp.]|uniref:GspH/FimT family pseudopilin n=1 Tax=Rhodoferax sp. TaxID=50421 RepID=UPI001EBC25AF|nr:GspH/FimT family pseudopilin [Rhodoferax sp.]MBT9507121.1 GspH/FimT family pseudopilin [Rhodoferax sp.]